jgi:hypothetical protein
MIRGLAAAAAVGLVLLSCARPATVPDTPATAEDAALELFRMAAEPDVAEERLERLFAPESDLQRRARLRDAQTLDGPGRAVVDLRAQLSGGGEALYSVRVEQDETEHWTVTWFQGPGVEWPASRSRRDEGLSTSAPPGAVRR